MYQVVHPDEWNVRFVQTEFFKDKLVFIGPGAAVFEDPHEAPVGVMRGAEIHLNQMNAALQGSSSGRAVRRWIWV